jgi:hypothetical protein
MNITYVLFEAAIEGARLPQLRSAKPRPAAQPSLFG